MIRAALALLPLLAVPAAAQEAQIAFGTGVLGLHADEIVYEGGKRISHLVWTTSAAPLLTAGLEVRWPEGWRLDVDGSFAVSGVSFMADYDWLGAVQPAAGFEDWTDRSLHPDTRLDFYASGRAAIGHGLVTAGPVEIGAALGGRYSAVRWTAWGGSYNYDSGADVGSFDPGARIISYEQRMPVGFVRLDASAGSGALRLDGSAELGLAIGPSDIDDHWLRGLRFYDRYGLTPVLRLAADASYAVSDRLTLTAGASLEHLFTVRGDTLMVDRTTGESVLLPDGAAMSFSALTLRAGAIGRF
ncbi:MAG: omptin family outer membrane protease [Devosia sp.]|uniref:omptin family outer membrane protease n=1 Tax=Devosia sp. TaxID=1871048 RepID=UPI001A4DD4D9|nr:omptin family outer membrane protease [Devosia sp.]MBL8599903.1 omptin family outer membrane protease [Devosia sp.]